MNDPMEAMLREVAESEELPLIYEEIHAERLRAHLKHRGSDGGSIELRPWDAERRLTILTEELGEVARVLNDREHGLHDGIETARLLRDELTQLAAMAAAWLDAVCWSFEAIRDES